MSRNLKNSHSRRLCLETLENREMLSVSDLGFDPSPEAQELLELINRMRTDPQGELTRLFNVVDGVLIAKDPRVEYAINQNEHFVPIKADLASVWSTLSAAPPLAWSASIAQAAKTHNELMLLHNAQEHQFFGEQSLFDRMRAAGFDPYYSSGSGQGAQAVVAENLFAYGYRENAQFSVASYTHAAFAIDWGVPDHAHRNNLMDPYFTEIGISMLRVVPFNEHNPRGVGEWVTTADFGKSTQSAGGGYLTGVVYDDKNGSDCFEAYEGISNVTVLVQSIGGEDVETLTTMTAGGYQIQIPNGTYDITVSGEGFFIPITKRVTISGANVKADFKVQEISEEPPAIDLNGPDLAGRNHSITYKEGTYNPVSLVHPGASVSDSDSRQLSLAEIYLLERPDGVQEILDLDTSGTLLSASFDSERGVLTVSGTGDLADYEKVLKTLSYRNLKNEVSLLDRTVCLTVSDGINLSELSTVTIRMEPAVKPKLTVHDGIVIEGDSEGRFLQFRVSVDSIPRRELQLHYALVDGTAIAGVDYSVPDSRVLRIAPGQTEALISIPVTADFIRQDDRSFSLWVTDAIDADCDTVFVTGTIRDDDNITPLGTRTGWKTTNVNLTDIRKIYSFTPGSDCLLTWEALGDEIEVNVKLSLHKGTHSAPPIAESMFINGAHRLQLNIEKDTTYVLLVEGDVNPSLLRMFQNAVPNGQRLEFQLDDINPGDVNVNFEPDGIGFDVPGYDPLRYDPSSFAWLAFNDAGSGRSLNISGRDPVIDAGRGIINIDGVDVDVRGFRFVTLTGTPEFNTVELAGTSGSDNFKFSDGIGRFEASDGTVYLLQNFENITIDGKGGADEGLLMDSPKDDCLTFKSGPAVDGVIPPGFVELLGGGHRITLKAFPDVEVVSSSGGRDLLLMECANGSNAVLRERISSRLEQQGETSFNYQAWYFPTVTVTDNDALAPSTVQLFGGNEGIKIVAKPGRTTASDHGNTFLHEVIGNADITVLSHAPEKDRVVVWGDAPAPTVTAPEAGMLECLLASSDIEYSLRFSDTAVFQYYYEDGNGDPAPSQPFEYRFAAADAVFATDDFDLFDFHDDKLVEENALENALLPIS